MRFFALFRMTNNKGDKGMNKKEFFIIATIAMYIYLAFIFHVNLKNFINVQKNPYAEFTINIFE